MRMRGDASAQAVQLDHSQNQLAEQGRDRDRAASVGEPRAKIGDDIESSQRDQPGHLDRMPRVRRDPYASMDWDDPGALGRPHRHDTARCINQLMPGMRMRSDHVAIGVFGYDASANLILPGVKKPVALFRHRMAL